MLTQFFGNYLLDKKIITPDQLLESLRYKNAHSRKLGNLAVSAGYMTETEVEDVHSIQATVDKKFAEIAVHMKYLTVAQADELIKAQHLGYLLLGNAVMTLGFCSQDVISKAIADYEFDYQLSFSTILQSDDAKLNRMIQNYYQFPEAEQVNPPQEYATLLLKNLIRFIGSDFRLLARTSQIPTLPYMMEVNQNITGDVNIRTAIVGYKPFLIQFASRYACDDFTELDDYVDASLQDFLNLHNGIFTVNMSTDHNLECDLSPTETRDVHITDEENWNILPIEFTFGTLYFCFSQI